MDESETFYFDAFNLCWDMILEESAQCEEKFFNSEYCKILDSRDNNFNIVENRLAYTYKYGFFNILFFEKCFLLFINQCADALFPFKNLKVCSLSNGPGFDVVGLLSALRSSNKPLKCLPVFNAINVHESWSRLYETLVSKAYKACVVRSYTEYFHLNPMNVNLIQGDIYTTLSSDTKYIISNSNVLLMFNVFVSSKASPTTFENSLKEIFTLLEPESLIFFIGSKNNMKLFSKLNNVKQYVKCICGPQEVTLNDLPINEQISNVIGVKPCNSGHAKFVVWQKKLNINDEESSGENVVADECDVSDTLSELSISSTVDNSDEFISKSPHSSTEEIKSKISISKPCSLSQNFIADALKLAHYSYEQYVHEPVIKDSNILDETVKINGASLANAETDATNIFIVNKTSPVHKLASNKPIMDPNTSNIKSKKKKESLNKDLTLNKNIQKDNADRPKTMQRKLSSNATSENTLENEKEKSFPATNTKGLKYTNSNVQSLLQRCDSLISKLEELTVDIKSDLNSSRKEDILSKTQFSVKQTENCKLHHHHNCCARVIHSCCCRKFCKH